MKKISVIVPCYNVEAYIDRCMDTIVKQTIGIENLQVILVNDASTDHTLDKLCAWEQRYPDSILIVTYDENIRQGGARNQGLQYAEADYIGFVDSDDWIELDMYEILYREAVRGNYDMVQGKYIESKGSNDVHRSGQQDRYRCIEYQFKKIKEEIYDYQVSDYGDHGDYGCIVTAIYKKSIIMNHHIWFPEKIAYEDNYWSSILKLYLRNLCIVDKLVYYYYVNPSSTVRSVNATYHMDRLAIEIGILDAYKERGIFEYYYKDLCRDFIQRFYLNSINIFFIRMNTLPDIFSWMQEQVLAYFPDYLEIIDQKNSNTYTVFEQYFLSLIGKWDTFSMNQIEELRKSYVKAVLEAMRS